MNYQIKTRTATIVFLLTVVLQFQLGAQDVSPILSWDFSEINNRTTIEQQSGIADTLEEYYNYALK